MQLNARPKNRSRLIFQPLAGRFVSVVERAVQRDRAHGCRPDARRRVYKEAARNPSEAVAEKLDGERRADLVSRTTWPNVG